MTNVNLTNVLLLLVFVVLVYKELNNAYKLHNRYVNNATSSQRHRSQIAPAVPICPPSALDQGQEEKNQQKLRDLQTLQKRYEILLKSQRTAGDGPTVQEHFQEFARINCETDDDRVRRILEINLGSRSWNAKDLKNEFYKSVMSPVQTSCKLMKKIGIGEWIKKRLWDGQKVVCMDDFEKKQGPDAQQCIVYSFSLHADESLIDTFLKYDCQVVPYVLGDAFYEYSPNKLAGFSFGKNFLVDLKEEFVKHGHEGKTIAYLKFDVYSEHHVIQDWIDSSALYNVQQLGLEFHHVRQNTKELFQVVQNLHRIGYRIINWDANFNFDFVDGVADVFEILFRRGTYCSGLQE